jgi:hypothetical protein
MGMNALHGMVVVAYERILSMALPSNYMCIR